MFVASFFVRWCGANTVYKQHYTIRALILRQQSLESGPLPPFWDAGRRISLILLQFDPGSYDWLKSAHCRYRTSCESCEIARRDDDTKKAGVQLFA